VRQAVQDRIQDGDGKVETPVAYLDAPEFRKFWDRTQELAERSSA